MTSFKKYFNTYDSDLVNEINCEQHSKVVITAVTSLFDSLELCFRKCCKENIFEALFEYCKLEYESHGNTDPMLLKYYFVASAGSLELIKQFALYSENCVIDLTGLKAVESEYYPLILIDNALFNNCINCISMPIFQNKSNVLTNCINCKFCVDCNNCIDCIDCVSCSAMIKCSNCKSSEKCSQCSYCTECHNCFKSKRLIRCSNCFNCSYCKTSNELIHVNRCVGCKYSIFIDGCVNCINCTKISDKDSIKHFIGHNKVNSSTSDHDLQDTVFYNAPIQSPAYCNTQYSPYQYSNSQQCYPTESTTNSSGYNDEDLMKKYPYIQYANDNDRQGYCCYNTQIPSGVNTCSQVQNSSYYYNQCYQASKPMVNTEYTYPPPPYYFTNEQLQVQQPISTTAKQPMKCSTGEARDRDRNFIKFRSQ